MISHYMLCMCSALTFIGFSSASVIYDSSLRRQPSQEYQPKVQRTQPVDPVVEVIKASEPWWLEPDHYISHRMSHIVRNLTSNLHHPLERRGDSGRLPIIWTDPPGVVYDSTCDSDRKYVVNNAWMSAISMTTSAKEAAKAVQEGLASQTGKTKQRKWVANNNYAYTQMFGADWIPDHADTVRGVFQTILDKIQTQNAPGRNNQPLVLSCRTHFASADSTDECAGNPEPNSFAIAVNRVEEPDLKNPNADPNAYLINFCPPFFSKLPRNEVLENEAEDGSKAKQICNLKSLATTAQVMIHEWTHIPWIKDTNANGNPKDEYGFARTAQRSVKTDNTPIFSTSSKNAESYAWFAVYNHWNNLDVCQDQGISYSDPRKTYTNENPGCTDVWPSITDVNDNNRKFVITRY